MCHCYRQGYSSWYSSSYIKPHNFLLQSVSLRTSLLNKALKVASVSASSRKQQRSYNETEKVRNPNWIMTTQIGLRNMAATTSFLYQDSRLLTSVSSRLGIESICHESSRKTKLNLHGRNCCTSTEKETSQRQLPANTTYSMSRVLRPLIYQENLSQSDLNLSPKFTGERGESAWDVEKPATPELLKNLVINLEYHFSDDALSRDLFLLKHIKRQNQGYVSIKLLAGYKKVKKLSRNWRVVGLAAQQSNLLEVNESCTRVRRRTPLPTSLSADLPSSRTIVAVDLPSNLCNIEALASRFSPHGSIAALQIIKPGQSSPPQFHAMLSKSKENCDSTCALIEFEDVWGARKALQDQYESPMTVNVMRNNKPRTPPELRTERRYHHQLNRLLDENDKQGSDSSGSEADDTFRSSRSTARDSSTRASPLQQLSFNTRFYSSAPSSPVRPRHFIPQKTVLNEVRSPRGPDGSRGFASIRIETQIKK